MGNETGGQRHLRVELPAGRFGEFSLRRRGDHVEYQVKYELPFGGGGGGNGNGWKRCERHNCLGEAIPNGVACLLHSTPEQRANHLNEAAKTGHVLSLNGVDVSQQLFDVIRASPIFSGGGPSVPISFIGSEISASLRISGLTFQRWMAFTGASFFAPVEFTDCAFQEDLSLSYAHFDSAPLFFRSTKFMKPVALEFSKADNASMAFEDCAFSGEFKANGIVGQLTLSRSSFGGALSIESAKATHIGLEACWLKAGIDVAGTHCAGFSAHGLRAQGVDTLGPFRALNVILTRSTFDERVRIEIAGSEAGASIDLAGANFRKGGLLLISGAEVDLKQLNLGGPLRISGIVGAETKITSLTNADAGNMTFSEVDMSRCGFYGAHDLADIDIESTVRFACGPWWTGHRRYIVDELAWRIPSGRRHKIGWNVDGIYVGANPEPRGRRQEPRMHLLPLKASQVAVAYRDLRRSLEAKSDMPGAADFYFGEMEMRRWSKETGLLERILIWFYWLLAGYALRPLRALLCWILIVALGALIIARYGLTPPVSFFDTILPAVKASLPGFPLAGDLSPTGEWAQVILRIVGPIQAALFILAVRAHLMRKANV